MIFLLTACGAETPKQKLEGLTALYAAEPAIKARARVTAQLARRSAVFVLDWETSGGVSYMTVAEPAELQGLTAETGDEGLTFRYDGLTLVIDPEGGTISPVEVLPELLYDWGGGLCLDRCYELLDGVETLCVSYSYQRGDLELEQRVWFARENLIPLRAELYEDGRMTAEVVFLLFEFT